MCAAACAHAARLLTATVTCLFELRPTVQQPSCQPSRGAAFVLSCSVARRVCARRPDRSPSPTPLAGSLSANASSAAHNNLARTLAEQSITLLKNDGNLLPLKAANLKSIGVFGDQTTVTGGGSGGVVTPYVITPYQGIMNVISAGLPPRVQNCTYIPNIDYYQPGAQRHPVPCLSSRP